MTQMDNSQSLPAEEFRNPEDISKPDARLKYMGITSVNQLHEAVKSFELNSHVDEKIRIQFDTVKNLYIHSFYVYRFFPIVKHQLYVTLEHGLRECIGEKELERFRKFKNKQLPRKSPKFSRRLKLCMTYAVEFELIKNEDFSIWRHGKEQQAEAIYRQKVFEIMESEGLDSYEWDESEIDYENVDYNHDYIEILTETS